MEICNLLVSTDIISVTPGMCSLYLLFHIYVINIFYLLVKVMLVMRLDMNGTCDNKISFDIRVPRTGLPAVYRLVT